MNIYLLTNIMTIKVGIYTCSAAPNGSKTSPKYGKEIIFILWILFPENFFSIFLFLYSTCTLYYKFHCCDTHTQGIHFHLQRLSLVYVHYFQTL